MILLLGFAFLSGLATILAPCIWPVLPIILSQSIAGKGHKRSLGITLGVMLSFTIFTLSVSTLVRIFHFDPNILRLFAVIVIAFLGLTMIIPVLSTKFELVISILSNLFGQNTNNRQAGFLPGFITGLSLGIIWSPCAGPILATITTLAATGRVNVEVLFVTGAYVAGVGIPLFIFSYAGANLINRAKIVAKYTYRIQQIFGIIMILTAIAIYTNYDQKLQLQLLNTFPQFGTAVTGFENSDIVKNQLETLKGGKSAGAPDFVGITKWLNTDKPMSIADLKGKVVLVDFWTYTCINCIRTLPHVTSWYDKYHDQGFVVIGVHTPEFEFEKDTNNVLNAIKMYKINYPVAQDNNYATWGNFNNQYWPAEYLIDANGNIRRTHFGEGEYGETEMAIQALLKESGKQVSISLDNMPDQTPKINLSPETYLGAKRMQYYYPSGNVTAGRQIFTLTEKLAVDSFSLGGEWLINDENAITGKEALLNYNFNANKVFLVLKPGNNTSAKAKVFLDGQLVNDANTGSDVKNGTITIDTDRLYNLIDLKGLPANHILKLEFQNPGIEVFAFTFG